MKSMSDQDPGFTSTGGSVVGLNERGSKTSPQAKKAGNAVQSEDPGTLEAQETGALKHVQVSAVGDVAEDGGIVGNQSTEAGDGRERP